MPDLKITQLTADTTPQGADLLTSVKSPFGAGSNRKITITNFMQNQTIDWKTTGKQAFGVDASLGTSDGRDKFFDLENTTTNFSVPGIDNYSCGKFVHILNPSIDLGPLFKATSSFLFQCDVPNTNSKDFYYGEALRIDSNFYGSGDYDSTIGLSTQSNNFGSGTISTSIGAYHYSYKGFESTCTIVNNTALQVAAFNSSNTGGQVTNNKGLEITAPNFWINLGFPLGTIVNNYGLYIADQNYSGSTLVRAIFSEGGIWEIKEVTGKIPNIYLSSADVATPFTGGTIPNNVGARISLLSSSGGAIFTGYTDNDNTIASALQFQGALGSTAPNGAAILMQGVKSDGGTGFASLGATEKVLTIYNNNNQLFSLLGNGDHQLNTGNLLMKASSAGTNAVGVLALGNGATAPTTSVDLVQLYAVDLSAGNATLGIFTETAVASGISVASTNTLTIKINGTNYRLLLAT